MRQTELAYRRTKGFSPFAYTIVGKWLYFCDQDVPYLFRYNMERKECECVAKFNSCYREKNFFKLISYKNELWLLPFGGNEIVRFNINKKEFINYNILEKNCEMNIPFCDMFFEKEEAYVIPFGNNPYLIRVDLSTYEMTKIELIKKEQSNDFLKFFGTVRHGNNIYILESRKNILILYDIDRGCVKTIYPNNCNLRDTFPVKGIENSIYFFPLNTNENIVIYDVSNKNFYEKKFPIKDFLSEEIYLVSVLEGEIWIFANKQKKIYSMNHEMEVKKEIDVLNFSVSDRTIYVSGIEFSDRFFWHGHEGSPLIQVKNNHVEIVDIYVDDSCLDIYLKVISERTERKKGFMTPEIGRQIYKNVLLLVKT